MTTCLPIFSSEFTCPAIFATYSESTPPFVVSVADFPAVSVDFLSSVSVAALSAVRVADRIFVPILITTRFALSKFLINRPFLPQSPDLSGFI
jgi:hypothetical protein